MDSATAEKQRAYYAAYYAKNKDKIADRHARWYTRNKDEISARSGRRQREFTEWLQILTSTHTCEMCGGPPDSWHHFDPTTKRASVSNMYCYSLDSIEDELEKCIPLCRSCHARLHREDGLLSPRRSRITDIDCSRDG